MATWDGTWSKALAHQETWHHAVLSLYQAVSQALLPSPVDVGAQQLVRAHCQRPGGQALVRPLDAAAAIVGAFTRWDSGKAQMAWVWPKHGACRRAARCASCLRASELAAACTPALPAATTPPCLAAHLSTTPSTMALKVCG